MKCPVCGGNNIEDARFCSLCLTPLRGDKADSPPITSQFSTPPDYPSEIEQPVRKRFGKFSDWFARFGCLVICLALVIPPAIMFLPPVISRFLSERSADCPSVSDRTFQREVLESPIPVLVVFISEEHWNMKRATPVNGGFTDPAPITLAVKSIIKEGKYKNKIKFCKYYTSSGEDSIREKYSIKIEWASPTIIVFTNGYIFWRDEGEKWCYVKDEMIEKDVQKIEVILEEVTGEP